MKKWSFAKFFQAIALTSVSLVLASASAEKNVPFVAFLVVISALLTAFKD